MDSMKISKRLVTMIVGAICGLALIVGLVVWFVPVFSVKDIVVEGNANASVESVVEASGVQEGENLIRVNPRKAASGVVSIPWVASATVSRDFPSTLTVQVEERETVAFVDDNDGQRLIDAQGEEFIIAAPPEEAVEISGEVESGSLEVTNAVEILAAVPREIRAQVAQLEIDDPYSYRFRMEDDKTVFWGANEDNENKALAFATVLKLDGKNWDISNPELVGRS